MKKSELVERLKRIWQYRCDGCLADTGGCSCAEDKDKMIMELINDLNVEKNEVIRGKQKTKCEECGNKAFYLMEELQENKKTKLAELNVFCVCTKCMKVNGSYTIKLGVPITMLGIIDFMIKSPKLLKFERGG